MADINRRLDALEGDAFEGELDRRLAAEVDVLIGALERGMSPPEFRKVLDILATLDRRGRE